MLEVRDPSVGRVLRQLVARAPETSTDADLAEGDRLALYGEADEACALVGPLLTYAARGEAVVVRGVGVDHRLLFALAYALNLGVYHCKRLGFCDIFEVEPFTSSLSETAEPGSFHTDFSASVLRPDFVVIQCVRPDPLYPLYGRNQIANVDLVLRQVQSAFGQQAVDHLLAAVLPHRFGDEVRHIPLVGEVSGVRTMRVHTRLVARDLLESGHFVGGHPLPDVLALCAATVADDFVLGTGDLVIFSNGRALHRRGECRLVFDEMSSGWRGRVINSIRMMPV